MIMCQVIVTLKVVKVNVYSCEPKLLIQIFWQLCQFLK